MNERIGTAFDKHFNRAWACLLSASSQMLPDWLFVYYDYEISIPPNLEILLYWNSSVYSADYNVASQPMDGEVGWVICEPLPVREQQFKYLRWLKWKAFYGYANYTI